MKKRFVKYRSINTSGASAEWVGPNDKRVAVLFHIEKTINRNYWIAFGEPAVVDQTTPITTDHTPKWFDEGMLGESIKKSINIVQSGAALTFGLTEVLEMENDSGEAVKATN